jgi:hypothetical protein
MSTLVWDAIGDRTYENGVDRGVLYLSDGTAIPWNGLKSVIEKPNKETESVYFDGRKISELTHPGEFSASISAVTYPDELIELEGYGEINNGVYVGDQPPTVFDLCYRTKIGNDLNPDAGYKIHVVYNVTAVPTERTFNTISDTFEMSEFSWDIYAIPEDIPGFRPTAHFIIDGRQVHPDLFEEIEKLLYGSSTQEASLPQAAELITFITNWVEGVQITDNGDGTWTASTSIDDRIVLNEATGEFTIFDVDAVFADADTYDISTTIDDD